MPIGLSPRSTFKLWLDTDIADYPDENERPTFRARYLSGDDHLEVADMVDKRPGTKDRREVAEITFALLRILIKDWTNCDELTWDNLRKTLTIREQNELVNKALEGQSPSDDDKKKSPSPQNCATDASAASADPKAAA